MYAHINWLAVVLDGNTHANTFSVGKYSLCVRVFTLAKSLVLRCRSPRVSSLSAVRAALMRSFVVASVDARRRSDQFGLLSSGYRCGAVDGDGVGLSRLSWLGVPTPSRDSEPCRVWRHAFSFPSSSPSSLLSLPLSPVCCHPAGASGGVCWSRASLPLPTVASLGVLMRRVAWRPPSCIAASCGIGQRCGLAVGLPRSTPSAQSSNPLDTSGPYWTRC